jgi:hypothetical protein
MSLDEVRRSHDPIRWSVDQVRRLPVLALTAVLVAGCGAGTSPTADPGRSVVGSVTAPTAPIATAVAPAPGSGGSGGRRGGPSASSGQGGNGAAAAEVIQVTKCYTNATATTGGELLIKASSSDPTARLFAYRPDGNLIGELQNGGGNRYGGTVMPYQPVDPGTVTIRSSSGGSISVPTTAFEAGDG